MSETLVCLLRKREGKELMSRQVGEEGRRQEEGKRQIQARTG